MPEEKDSYITSVEFDKEDFEYISKLIEEAKVRSLKEFVEKCVKLGRIYTIDQWETGVSTIGPTRVIILPKKILELLIQRVPNEEYADIGREIGEFIQSFALFKGINATDPDNWDEALKLLTDFRLGNFTQINDKIQVIHPVFPSEITESLIKTTLNIELKPIRMLLDVHMFQIVKGSSSK